MLARKQADRGVSIKDYDLDAMVKKEDPHGGARAWNRALAEVYKPEHLIGYATFMGPGNATTIEMSFGWTVVFNKFQPQKIHIKEDWEALGKRASFQLTEEAPDPLDLHRREELQALELHELRVIAKELDILAADDKRVSKPTLIDRIVENERENR